MRPFLLGPAPWAVILCRFNDVATPTVPRERFFEFVTEYGTEGLFDYWQEVSLRHISTAGSDVFGWYTMAYSFVADSRDPFHNPADARKPRDAWIAEARRLAALDGVDLSAYDGVIAVINASGDSSNSGTDMVMNVWGAWGQSNWRWCNKCQGLFFAGGASLGHCTAGGNHDATGSYDYALAMNDAAYPGQNQWRWCAKCQGLMFAGNRSLGACAAGGEHDHTGSADYRLATSGQVGHDGQDHWRWCSRCQSLAFNGAGALGPCSAGGSHDHAGSLDYLLVAVDTRLNLTYAAHETGHGYGLEHAWSANPDVEYGDPWDIMSAMRVRAFPISSYTEAGPGLSAPKLYKLGWLPDARVVTQQAFSTAGPSGMVTRLNALDRASDSGLLMARVITADRVFTVEYRRPVRWDRGMGSDAVFIHELRSHYTVGQVNWRWCSKCYALFYAGWAACAAGGLHDHSGSYDYHIDSGASAPGQANWRWCKKCQELVRARPDALGRCAAGGEHDTAASFDYHLPSQGDGQRGWKWCRKCQGLTFTGSARAGACPAGGAHNHDGSNEYTLSFGARAPGQATWRWCRRCQAMCYAGLAPCAAGGAHEWWGSADYGLAPASIPVNRGQSDWQWCRKCQQLTYVASGSPGACSGGGTHDHSGSGQYALATSSSGMTGQSNWRLCSRCQTLAYAGGASPGACAAGGQHVLTTGLDYVVSNFGDDRVYLVGADRHVNAVFDDPARNVHIAVTALDSVSGVATIELGYPSVVSGLPGVVPHHFGG